jgi:hypothetical protein
MDPVILTGDVQGGGPTDGIIETLFPLASGHQPTHAELLLTTAYGQISSGQVRREIGVPSPGRIDRTVVTSGGQLACPFYGYRMVDRQDYDGVGSHFRMQYLGYISGGARLPGAMEPRLI